MIYLKGGSSGIGGAIVDLCAEQEINVVIAALNDKLLKEKLEAVREKYPKLEFKAIGCDLSKPGYLETIQKETQNLDINLIFNNAGYIKPGLFADLSLEVQMKNYHCNATSSLEIAQYFASRLKSNQRKGLITFTSSSAGFIPCVSFFYFLIHINVNDHN
jgi:short-subunit dehydrogenase